MVSGNFLIGCLVTVNDNRLQSFMSKLSLDSVQFLEFLENSQNSHIEEANFQKLGMIVGI